MNVFKDPTRTAQ